MWICVCVCLCGCMCMHVCVCVSLLSSIFFPALFFFLLSFHNRFQFFSGLFIWKFLQFEVRIKVNSIGLAYYTNMSILALKGYKCSDYLCTKFWFAGLRFKPYKEKPQDSAIGWVLKLLVDRSLTMFKIKQEKKVLCDSTLWVL